VKKVNKKKKELNDVYFYLIRSKEMNVCIEKRTGALVASYATE